MVASVKLGMVLNHTGRFDEPVELLLAYEQDGLQLAAVPESYPFGSVSKLGYLAAKTETLELMSAILQVYSRTPALTAMTAAGLDYVSGGRFTLGLGPAVRSLSGASTASSTTPRSGARAKSSRSAARRGAETPRVRRQVLPRAVDEGARRLRAGQAV